MRNNPDDVRHLLAIKTVTPELSRVLPEEAGPKSIPRVSICFAELEGFIRSLVDAGLDRNEIEVRVMKAIRGSPGGGLESRQVARLIEPFV